MSFKKLQLLIKNKISNTKEDSSREANVFKNMAKLAAGTGMAKAVSFIMTPLITRIYLPEHMGVLSVFLSVVALLVPFSTLRYTIAIPLPKNDGLAINLVIFCFLCLTVISSVAYFILFLSAPFLFTSFNIPELEPYWWFLPIAIFGTGFYEILSNWAIRERQFKAIAKTVVLQSLTGSLTKICFGLVGLKPVGLLFGHIFYQSGGISFLVKQLFSKIKSNYSSIRLSRILFLSKYFSDFPKFRVPGQVFLVIAQKAPLIVIASLYGLDNAGQLGLAFTIIAVPLGLFGTTTAKAFYGEISQLGHHNQKAILRITKSVTKKLFMVSLIPFFILILAGPWLFRIFFGEEWELAGVFASILSFSLLGQFLYSPIGNGIFNVFKKQKLVLLINFVRTILVLCVLGLAYIFSISINVTLGLYSLVLGLYYFGTILMVFHLIKNPNQYI